MGRQSGLPEEPMQKKGPREAYEYYEQHQCRHNNEEPVPIRSDSGHSEWNHHAGTQTGQMCVRRYIKSFVKFKMHGELQLSDNAIAEVDTAVPNFPGHVGFWPLAALGIADLDGDSTTALGASDRSNPIHSDTVCTVACP